MTCLEQLQAQAHHAIGGPDQSRNRSSKPRKGFPLAPGCGAPEYPATIDMAGVIRDDSRKK
jgi:hypothetical protein